MKLRNLSIGTAIRIWALTGVIGAAPVLAAFQARVYFFPPAELAACLDPLWGTCGSWTYAVGRFLEAWAFYAAASLPCCILGIWFVSRFMPVTIEGDAATFNSTFDTDAKVRRST
jgi:hypothetical protein